MNQADILSYVINNAPNGVRASKMAYVFDEYIHLINVEKVKEKDLPVLLDFFVARY